MKSNAVNKKNKQIDLFATSLANLIIQQIIYKKNGTVNKKVENK